MTDNVHEKEILRHFVENGFKLSIEEVKSGGEIIGVVRKGDWYSAFTLNDPAARRFLNEFILPSMDAITSKIKETKDRQP